MALEQAIVARAAATAAVTTAIGSRFFNAVAPQNAARPYVVFDVIGGEGRSRSFANGVDIARQRVQMTVVAALASEEAAVHAALRTAFDWWAGTLGGTEVVHAQAEGARVAVDSEQTLPDTRVTAQDYLFVYRE